MEFWFASVSYNVTKRGFLEKNGINAAPLQQQQFQTSSETLPHLCTRSLRKLVSCLISKQTSLIQLKIKQNKKGELFKL